MKNVLKLIIFERKINLISSNREHIGVRCSMGKRKTIGVVVGGVTDDFTHALSEGIKEASKKYNVNFILFMSTSMVPYFIMRRNNSWMESLLQQTVLDVIRQTNV